MKLGSLHPTRDLNFVTNTVDGFLLAAVSDKAIGETINLGSGREISIQDLANLIAELLQKKITITSEVTRVRPENSEVDRLLADNTKARTLLGWEPRIALREGLELTIKWLREHQKFYRAGTYTV